MHPLINIGSKSIEITLLNEHLPRLAKEKEKCITLCLKATKETLQDAKILWIFSIYYSDFLKYAYINFDIPKNRSMSKIINCLPVKNYEPYNMPHLVEEELI